MQGMIVFRSLADAVRHGYEIYDRTSDGYVMRKRTEYGFGLALVRPTNGLTDGDASEIAPATASRD